LPKFDLGTFVNRAPGPLQSLLLLYGTDYQLAFEPLRARFRHLHKNWKLFYASRRIWGLFILRGRNWLIIIIIIQSSSIRGL